MLSGTGRQRERLARSEDCGRSCARWTAAIVDALRFRRQGALCSSSAAMPPTCGAAADVPKNGAGNDPAPVIDTPSIAAMSGFRRPSSVGPRLLKNSGVTFDVSRHDSSGAAPENAPAAAADAEQIAPTDDHAHRRSAGVALRRDAARCRVVVVALVARRREQRRPGGRALGLERKDVQVPRLRRVAHVLHDDAEAIRRAGVDVVDDLRRILPAALHVGAARHDAARALLDEIEVVVVARPAERIVPRQEDRHLAVLRQRRSTLNGCAPRPSTSVVSAVRWNRCRCPGVVMPAIDVPSTPEST